MKFYRLTKTNEVLDSHAIRTLREDEYTEINKPDKELMIDEFWYPKSALRNEKIDNLFQKKFEEHRYENNDISMFSQLRSQMESCTSYIDMWRLIQDLSRLIMQFQYEEWLNENYPKSN